MYILKRVKGYYNLMQSTLILKPYKTPENKTSNVKVILTNCPEHVSHCSETNKYKFLKSLISFFFTSREGLDVLMRFEAVKIITLVFKVFDKL